MRTNSQLNKGINNFLKREKKNNAKFLSLHIYKHKSKVMITDSMSSVDVC